MATTRTDAEALAIVLHDLAWLLPRTIGAEAARAEPLPPTALEVMRLLTRRPGRSVNEVAAEIGVAANNVSTAVSQLEARGLLARRRDEADGRVIRLHPTATAHEARLRRERSWAERMAAALAHLPGDDADRLVSALPALRHLADGLAEAEE
ncbi:MarR family winged helix-turn-helix transcriptional regulator [Actinoplanes sp. NPDC026619]|uniref:MarR family winged helix-turn-helix transcriptional regulator n=1 Tax=Actinoplanes sp. NPDC026619 TaxID=3155798 RepID=UPI0033EF61FD